MNRQKVKDSIDFLTNWIKTDLKEIGDDRSSDYANLIIDNHEHILTAIEFMQNEVDPTRGHAE